MERKETGKRQNEDAPGETVGRSPALTATSPSGRSKYTEWNTELTGIDAFGSEGTAGNASISLWYCGLSYPGPPSLCWDATCDSPFQPNCDNRTRPPSSPAPSPFAGRTVTPSASSHSACLRVAAGFARGEISPELATTRCHGTKSGLGTGAGKGSSALPLRADSGSGRYGFDSREGSTLSAAPTLLVAMPDQH